MEFRILGPLEVFDEGRSVDVGAAKQRALLAVLLLNANRVVSSDRLIEALWGERPPATAQKALQVYVSQLRKAVGRDSILTRAPGYELRVEPGELDLERFEALVAEERLVEALRLWRGTPARRLRLRAVRADRDRAPRGARARRASSSGSRRTSRRTPRSARRRARGARSRAPPPGAPARLSSCSRSTARGDRPRRSTSTRRGRTLLSDELGLEPGAGAEGAPARDPRTGPGTRPATAASSPRADLTSPTRRRAPRRGDAHARGTEDRDGALLRRQRPSAPSSIPSRSAALTARGFDEVLPVLERHGATVERSLGDAVTAIFGIPVVHEDDALRAVRAATEMRERLAELRGGARATLGRVARAARGDRYGRGRHRRRRRAAVRDRRGGASRRFGCSQSAGQGERSDRRADAPARSGSRRSWTDGRALEYSCSSDRTPRASEPLRLADGRPRAGAATPARRVRAGDQRIVRASSSRFSVRRAWGSRVSFGSFVDDVAGGSARRARPLSPVRRGDHVLAGARGGPRRRRPRRCRLARAEPGQARGSAREVEDATRSLAARLGR